MDKEYFHIEYQPGNKDIQVVGPQTRTEPLRISIYYDDCDHDATMLFAQQMTELLNRNWSQRSWERTLEQL